MNSGGEFPPENYNTCLIARHLEILATCRKKA